MSGAASGQTRRYPAGDRERAEHTADEPARVVAIADGDTTTVIRAYSALMRIRLAGIDALEVGQPGDVRAKKVVAKLVLGRKVAIHPVGLDRHGRIVADPHQIPNR